MRELGDHEPINQDDMVYDAAIIGLGPGGLAAALQAASSSKQVIAFTDRDNYVRPHRLVILKRTRDFLYSYSDPDDPEDNKFLNRMDLENTVQTKDLERYLFKKLKGFDNVKIVTVNHNKNAEASNIHAIHVESRDKHIELLNGQRFKFKQILAADGGRGDTAKKISGAQEQAVKIKSKEQERHEYHAVINLTLPKTLAEGIVLKERTDPNFLSRHLKAIKLGWRQTFAPKYYVFPNLENSKFYVAGEIPKSIFDIEDEHEKKVKLKEWAIMQISERYVLSPEAIAALDYRVSTKNPIKDQLQAACFKMDMVQLDRSTIDLGDNSVMAFVGDARRTPNYNLGHGMNDAILGGVKFANCLQDDGGFDCEHFAQYARERDMIIKMAMDKNHKNDVHYEANAIVLYITIDKLMEELSKFPEDLGELNEKCALAKMEYFEGANPSGLYEILEEVKGFISSKIPTILDEQLALLNISRDSPLFDGLSEDAIILDWVIKNHDLLSQFEDLSSITYEEFLVESENLQSERIPSPGINIEDEIASLDGVSPQFRHLNADVAASVSDVLTAISDQLSQENLTIARVVTLMQSVDMLVEEEVKHGLNQ